jgi:hypothetical protein
VFYTVIKDEVYSVAGHKIALVDRIPLVRSPGYARICSHNGIVLTTNEHQFYELDGGKLRLRHFMSNGQ